MARYALRNLRTFVPHVDVPYESALVFPGAFTPKQCDRIVEYGLSLTAEGAEVGGTREEQGQEDITRRSRTAWVEPDEAPWIFDKLGRLAQRANRTYGFDLLGFTEDAQFTLYDEPGAFYDWHQDGLGGEVAIRKLAIVVQLSDPADYRGGALEVMGVVHEYEPDDVAAWSDDARARGSVIVFPAFEYHRVTPIVSGKRYSLVCWVGGPPFR